MASNLGDAGVETRAEVLVRVVWSVRAASQVNAIQAYVEQFSPLAAQRLALRLINAGNSLDLFPERGRPVRGGDRELLSVKPYIIRYGIVGDQVTIKTVRHGARRPLP